MSSVTASCQRIAAMVLRHVYLLKSSWPRVLEMVYWPTVQMILWGFITLYLMQSSRTVAQAAGLFLSGVLLWDVLFRGQLNVSLGLLEEMYSRNLGHLFVSPLRPFEMVLSLFTISLIRTVIGTSGAAFLAIPIFDFSVFATLGLPLVAFFANLILFGWCMGLIISGFVMRLGLGAESLAWALIFLIQPVSGVYYPIDVLPGWLQAIAFVLPSSHVFEGMRAVLLDHVFRWDELAWAVGLNLAWLAGAGLVFLAMFRSSRRHGVLLSVGE
ncbi:ABC transporter permease [Marinivivus vitaminiproducens]|uniref:ABC transporter permease n=1 Tax=Marinivivus vitaminiproducens TaxID=3035935 RepID=UPI0027A2A7AE|nr:ABC transporter permease [Geminicoccaceae bacterium SCSIO 64248]